MAKQRHLIGYLVENARAVVSCTAHTGADRDAPPILGYPITLLDSSSWKYDRQRDFALVRRLFPSFDDRHQGRTSSHVL